MCPTQVEEAHGSGGGEIFHIFPRMISRSINREASFTLRGPLASFPVSLGHVRWARRRCPTLSAENSLVHPQEGRRVAQRVRTTETADNIQ